MRIVGGMILRNGVKMAYPFREAILSALPLCEAFFVSVGQSDDGTREAVEALADPRIHIIDSVWDLSLRQGGAVLATETNKLLQHLPTADWLLILQADEVLHEEDYPKLQGAMERWQADQQVEGLLFEYLHFYGSYEWVGASRRWYRREVRIIRPLPDIRAYQDAQGFRRNGRKLRVKPTGARIFHYGWVRPPEAQLVKFVEMTRFWHSDEWIAQHMPERFVYHTTEVLRRYDGTHPAVMAERLRQPLSWEFIYDPKQAKLPWRDRFLHWIEKKTGWRPGEFRNYRFI